jgi:glycosyltransferase involved in cell wall biosynthesis
VFSPLPIKVFVDAHLFDQEFQGSRTFLKEIYTRLAARSDVQLFLAAFDPDNLRREFNNDNRILYLQYSSRSRWKRLLFDIPMMIRRNKIDVAHFQYIIPPLRKYCSYLVTIHDVIFEEHPADYNYPYRITRRKLYRTAAQNADILTTVSSFSKRSIEKYLDIPEGKTDIIPNAVGDRFFVPFDKKTAREKILKKYGIDKYILYVSRFEPRKNQVQLLEAYLSLELYKEGIQLVLVGHPTLPIPAFQQLLDRLSSSQRPFIRILHEVNDEELLLFYQAAQLFVYPSKAEGFGIPPLEAAALKIPVICSNDTAMSEYTFFDKNLIDIQNSENLKLRIRDILENPIPADELEKIAEKVKELYSWDRSAERLYNLIKSVKPFSFLNKQNHHDQLRMAGEQ